LEPTNDCAGDGECTVFIVPFQTLKCAAGMYTRVSL